MAGTQHHKSALMVFLSLTVVSSPRRDMETPNVNEVKSIER